MVKHKKDKVEELKPVEKPELLDQSLPSFVDESKVKVGDSIIADESKDHPQGKKG